MPDDVEMGDCPPSTTTTTGGGPCAPAPTHRQSIRPASPCTPTASAGPSAPLSPDELCPSPTSKAAGPSKAANIGKHQLTPTTRVTRSVTATTVVRASARNAGQRKNPAPVIKPALPLTPTNKPANPPVAKTTTRDVSPAVPMNLLGKTNKRPKRPVSEIQSPEQAGTQPQKPTSSASKADEQQWLRWAKGYIEMAHAITPAYAEILRAIDAAIQGEIYQTLEARTEKLLARLENQLNKSAPSAALTTQQTPSIPQAASDKPSELKTPATYASTVKAAGKTRSAPTPSKTLTTSQPATPKEREASQLVLLKKKNETLPAYSSRSIRNSINNSIIKGGQVKGPVVGAVTTSKNGNIVLTTIPPYNADLLKSYQPQWQDVVKTLPIEDSQIQRPWLKLVAHGVLTEVGEDFQEECEIFNPIKVKGAVRWLKKPTKSTGSMVFAVATQEEQSHCLNKGLLIAGRPVTIVKFKTHSQYSQCFRCQGFGHDPAKCTNRVACKLCAGKHYSKSHNCKTCQASTECAHTTLKCINCGGQHAANSPTCEILKAVRGSPSYDQQAPVQAQPTSSNPPRPSLEKHAPPSRRVPLSDFLSTKK